MLHLRWADLSGSRFDAANKVGIPLPAARMVRHRESSRPAAGVISAILAVMIVISGLGPVGLSAQTDEEIRALVENSGDSGDYPGASRLVLLDKTDVEVEKSGLAHVRRHVLTKILTTGGVLGEAVQRFDYDPASNLVRVEIARIFRKDGSVEEIDISGIRDLFAPAHSIYWGARMKLLGIPRLEIGDALEIETYKKGFEIAYLDGVQRGSMNARERGGGDVDEGDSRYMPPMRGHFYDVVIFQGDHPMVEKRYDLHTPVGKPVRYEVYNGTLFSAQGFDDEKIHHSWWRRDVPAVRREPRMAALSDIAVKVVLATVPSWEEKSRWFAAIHDTIFHDNEGIRKKVKEMTAGKKGDMEKIAEMLHWAAQEIRYTGISMGKGEGYTIHPGWMIFHDRCGVCKDKAGMLVTLMRSAGYEVYPALTMAGSRVEEIPADQFNHCVVAWRRGDESYTMLDPTWVPYSTELWSSAEQEQNYVIGTPWGEDLMKTPYCPPEDHVLKIISRGDIDEYGNLRGTMKINGTNYMDQRMRRYLGTHRRDDLRAFIEGWMSSVSSAVELEKYSIGDPLDFSSEFVLSLEYRVPGFALRSGGILDFSSPAWKLAAGCSYLLSAMRYVREEKREHPLFIWFTQTLECDETVRLPGGFKPKDTSTKMDECEEYASFVVERSFKGRVLKNNGRVLVKNRTIPPEGYAGFKRVLEKAEEYADSRIVAEK